jgi:hypothetical protein
MTRQGSLGWLKITVALALVFLLGAATGWGLRKPPRFPDQVSVTGTVTAFDDRHVAFAFKPDRESESDASVGYGITYRTLNENLLRVGAHVRLIVLRADGFREIILEVQPVREGG